MKAAFIIIFVDLVLMFADVVTDVYEWQKRGAVSSLNKYLSIVARFIVFAGLAFWVGHPIQPDMPYALVNRISWQGFFLCLLQGAFYWIVFDLAINFGKGYQWNRVGTSAITDKVFQGNWVAQYIAKALTLAACLFLYLQSLNP